MYFTKTPFLTFLGIHAVPMDEEHMENWLNSHHYTFVNYYAPWCVWCQRLEPVWEAFAEMTGKEDLPVSIVKVDCAANSILCIQQKVIVSTSNTSLYQNNDNHKSFSLHLKKLYTFSYQPEIFSEPESYFKCAV
jgi:thiol-disulfide isomerase/thioredoxin